MTSLPVGLDGAGPELPGICPLRIAVWGHVPGEELAREL